MLRPNHVLALCFVIFFQPAWAETIEGTEELDEEFLEILGSFEAEEDDWYDFFLSTMDETMQEGTLGEQNE